MNGPKLLANVSRADGHGVELDADGHVVHLELECGEGDVLAGVLRLLDGQRSIADVAREAGLGPDDVREVVGVLEREGLVEPEASTTPGASGWETLLGIEDFLNQRLYATLYRNVFWQHVTQATLPLRVIHGMVIENYHVLVRQHGFDTPLLSYAPSAHVRAALHEFYADEHGHDAMLAASLRTIGVTPDRLRGAVPLPATMAMCNVLTHWAYTDPLAFFLTLGVLEGKDVAVDSFVEALEWQGVAPAFVTPLRRHAETNRTHAHGSLSREIFHGHGWVGAGEGERLRARLWVFVELYDQFFTDVWSYYGDPETPLVRSVDDPRTFRRGTTVTADA